MLESRNDPYWDLINFSHIKQFLCDVDDFGNRSKAETVFANFDEHIVPKLSSLEKSVIHGDLNGLNIILRREPTGSTYQLAGVIDFGDTFKACTIFDLGICLAYLMLENMDPIHCPTAIEFVGPLIAGYHHIMPLGDSELNSLYHLVLARCVQSAVMAAHSFKAEPWNNYILTGAEKAWALVDLMLSMRKEVVDEIWKNFYSV